MREQVELEWWDRECWMRDRFLRDAGNRLNCSCGKRMWDDG
jgi:hypothetical protein